MERGLVRGVKDRQGYLYDDGIYWMRAIAAKSSRSIMPPTPGFAEKVLLFTVPISISTERGT
jgi:hypothetical protein